MRAFEDEYSQETRERFTKEAGAALARASGRMSTRYATDVIRDVLRAYEWTETNSSRQANDIDGLPGEDATMAWRRWRREQKALRRLDKPWYWKHMNRRERFYWGRPKSRWSWLEIVLLILLAVFVGYFGAHVAWWLG